MDWFPWLAIPIKNIYYFHFIGFTMKWSYQVLSVLLFATLKNHLVSDFHGKPRSNCFCLLHSKWNSLISINFSVEEVFFFQTMSHPWTSSHHFPYFSTTPSRLHTSPGCDITAGVSSVLPSGTVLFLQSCSVIRKDPGCSLSFFLPTALN